LDGNDRTPGQRGQPAHALDPARRALVDLRFAAGDRFRIRPAGRVAAFRALGLRQQVFDLVGEGFHGWRLGGKADIIR
jgi:hypothetical protein